MTTIQTTNDELASQLAMLYHDVGVARREGNFEKVNLLERLAPRFEIALSCKAGKKCLSPRCRRNHYMVAA